MRVVVTLTSSVQAINCPAKVSCSVCSAPTVISAYTALLFTVTFDLDFWKISAASEEVKEEEHQIAKLSEMVGQLVAVDEQRAARTDNANFISVLERLKKQYKRSGSISYVRKMDNILRSYRLTPSYYVFT